MKYPKRSQYKYAKSRYRVRNWADYEAGLQRRGDLTVWLSDAALTIRVVFHLALRQTEGFLRSIARLLEVELPIPDHTTLSRRLNNLGEIRFHRVARDRPIYLGLEETVPRC